MMRNMTSVVKYLVAHKLYSCFETCYWHLIEERFCFDETIASYQEPIAKQEKNNNLFDNMAFYDSVSVIAGRSIVTIDPLPEKKNQIILEQPKRLTKKTSSKKKHSNEKLPSVQEEIHTSSSSGQEDVISIKAHGSMEEEFSSKRFLTVKKTVSFENLLSQDDLKEDSGFKSDSSLPETKVELRRKSLKERRMSKSLSLRIDYPEELPIIRQSSVPKFFLDTPEDNQTESSLIRTPLTALQSPMGHPDGFHFDLKSVVHIETTKKIKKDVPSIHREYSVSKLSQMKKNIKLRKTKSTVSASNIPHTNYI